MEIKLLAIAVILLAISNIAIHIQIRYLRDEISYLLMRLYGREHKTPSKPKTKPLEPTEEQRQYNTLMSNIENYNGTGQNQQKVR